MEAIPSRPTPGAGEVVTGISCPDCPGVLAVSVESKRLRFRCRVGHVYAFKDLIKEKEERLEDALWAPITALDELAAILREAVKSGEAGPLAIAYEERAARALRHVESFRSVIEDSIATPVEFDPHRPESPDETA